MRIAPVTSSIYRTASVPNGDSWKHIHSIASIAWTIVVAKRAAADDGLEQYGEVCHGRLGVDAVSFKR